MTLSDPPVSAPLETDHNACGVNPQHEAELAAAGWERRNTAKEPRLSEAAEGYRALGFEVHLEPFDSSAKSKGDCTACFDNPDVAKLFMTVFTRKIGAGPDGKLS